MRGCLVQISPLDPHTGARVLIRAGASLNAATLRADGLEWFSAVSKPPKLSLDFFDINYTGAVQTAKATLELNTTRMYGMGRDYLNTLIWQGAPITLWSGDGNKTAAMRTEFVGLVTQGTIERGTGKLPLQCEVNKKLVDVPLLNAEFGGGTGYDGDPEVRGQLRPACFGSPVNVPVFFMDQVNWIGQVDGYGNVTAIDSLYENAASFGPKQADYASYALLLAATIPEGAWATCVAQGLIRLGANPQGVITADPVCGYGTPGAMMLRWLTAHAGVSAGYRNDASFVALDTALAALLGHAPAVSYYTQGQVQVSDRMQAMCAACNATWFIGPDGKIAVSRAISTSAPALTLQRLGGRPLVTDWRSLDAPEPWWRLKAEAAKTWRVHALNEIDYEDDIKDMGNWDVAETYRQGMVVFAPWDGSRYVYINATPSYGHVPPNATYWDIFADPVDATAVKYADGTPLEDLKPAAPNADVTADNVAAAIDGQGPFATAPTIDHTDPLYFNDPGRVAQLDPVTGQIIDLRGLQSNRTYGLKSLYSPPSFSNTYDAGTNTWTINVGAATFLNEIGTTITLPTATIPGCTPATQYYIGYNMADPNSSAGSYFSSTTLSDVLAVGKIYIGFFTTGASGGGGGGGGGGTGGIPYEQDCVIVEAFIPTVCGELQARDVGENHRIKLLADHGEGTVFGPVEENFCALARCVELESETGIRLTCSITTPLTLRDGSCALAPNAQGHDLPVEDASGFRWEEIVSVRDAGERWVAHIRCHQRVFAAGDAPRRYIFTHNVFYYK